MNKKIWLNLALGLFVYGLPSLAFSQAPAQRVAWETLANITWDRKYNQKYQQHFQYPKFAGPVQALDGREVIIKGYVLPIEVGGDYIVLSRFPYESCFFCGGAGPESVMEVHIKNPKLINKKTATFKGKLRLNATDVDALVYILEDCELMPDVQ
jgi:hypothetical protein